MYIVHENHIFGLDNIDIMCYTVVCNNCKSNLSDYYFFFIGQRLKK